MLSEPRTLHRPEQPYVAIRTRVAMHDVPTLLPPLVPEVFAWLEARGIADTGPMFFHYLGYDDNVLTAEVGVPVAHAVPGDGRVISAALPAGQYASITYTGDYKHLKDVHMALEKWLAAHGLKEQCQATDRGVTWGSRAEVYITDPADNADPATWVTEVMFLLA